MNWFTMSFVSYKSTDKKAALAAENDCCEHVEVDSSVMFAVSRENDSFGSEGYCMCESCYQAQQKQVEQETHVCRDCKQEFTLESGGVLWKWYDFYAAQGDEEIPICGECRKKEKHINRIRRDIEDRYEEMNR